MNNQKRTAREKLSAAEKNLAEGYFYEATTPEIDIFNRWAWVVPALESLGKELATRAEDGKPASPQEKKVLGDLVARAWSLRQINLFLAAELDSLETEHNPDTKRKIDLIASIAKDFASDASAETISNERSSK